MSNFFQEKLLPATMQKRNASRENYTQNWIPIALCLSSRPAHKSYATDKVTALNNTRYFTEKKSQRWEFEKFVKARSEQNVMTASNLPSREPRFANMCRSSSWKQMLECMNISIRYCSLKILISPLIISTILDLHKKVSWRVPGN